MRKLASVWIQRQGGVIWFNSSSGQYVDLDDLLPLLRRRYLHDTAYVYACPKYGKMVRCARDKQKEPNVLLLDKAPIDEAWEIFVAHARML